MGNLDRPVNADHQTLVRVAWLYFMEGRTQSEIADALGTNRLRINRIINEARRSGLVGIQFNSRLASCVELEHELVGRGLKAAIIVPTPADPELVPVLIGQATAQYIAQTLRQTSIRGLGVGWGATLREMVRHMPEGRFPELCVNSVMGGLTHGLEINTFEIASDLARRLGANCEYFAAPIYAGSPDSRDTIVAQDVFQKALRLIRGDEMIVLSVGDLTTRSLLVRFGLPDDIPIAELRACGATGDMLGQFFDAGGRPVEHEVNRRAVALPLADLAGVPTVVVASGGRNKAAAITAVLRARLASVLVCDEETARVAASAAA